MVEVEDHLDPDLLVDQGHSVLQEEILSEPQEHLRMDDHLDQVRQVVLRMVNSIECAMAFREKLLR